MIKVALIGIGGMGGCHFNAYKKIKDAEIIAVADVRTEMTKEKVDDENIHIYHDMQELLKNETPDMVDICTPSYMHAELSIQALEKGIHVLCEKPMSLSTNDTKRMIEAAEKSGKFFMTAHVVRFMSAYKYLKSVVDSKELGEPVHIDMKRLSVIPDWSWKDWMRDISKSGGSPIDLSIHDFDFVQYVFGQPKNVSGIYRKLRDNNDYITTELAYDKFSVTVTGGWFSCDIPFKAEYIAVFEKGYIEAAHGKIIKNGIEVELDKGEISENTGINLSGADGYADEIAYFVSCIKNNQKPEIVTPESSQNSIKLVEEILKNSIVL